MTFLIGASIVCAVLIFAYYVKSGHFFKSFFKGTILGVICLVAVVFGGKYININLPLNVFTLSYSAILGLPAVVLMVITKYLL